MEVMFLMSEVPLYLRFCGANEKTPPFLQGRETDVLLPNNQRQHCTSHALKDVLPIRICANNCHLGQGKCEDTPVFAGQTYDIPPGHDMWVVNPKP